MPKLNTFYEEGGGRGREGIEVVCRWVTGDASFGPISEQFSLPSAVDAFFFLFYTTNISVPQILSRCRYGSALLYGHVDLCDWRMRSLRNLGRVEFLRLLMRK